MASLSRDESFSIEECQDDKFELLLQPNVLKRSAKSSRINRHWKDAVILLLLVVNIVVCAIGVCYFIKTRRTCPHRLYSPIDEVLDYEVRTLNTSIFVKNRYIGDPNQANSREWDQYFDNVFVRVTEEELSMVNRTSVALPDGGYLASVEALHNIHCVGYLRKRLYPEYFGNKEKMEDPHTTHVHTAHCLDNLRQVLQCYADTTLLTYSWRPDYLLPWADFQVTKECKNFDKINEWAASRTVKLTDPTNPIFDREHAPTGAPTDYEDGTELIGGTRALGIETQPDY